MNSDYISEAKKRFLQESSDFYDHPKKRVTLREVLFVGNESCNPTQEQSNNSSEIKAKEQGV